MQDLLPAWSPDGTMIAFTRRVIGGVQRVYVGGTDPQLRRASATEYDGSEYWPKWSRSGRYLAFLREEQGATNLVVVEVGTSTEYTVTTSGAVTLGFS